MNLTLQPTVDQSYWKCLTKDKKNFNFRQFHKEEGWKYKKENKNIFRLQHDCLIIDTKYDKFTKALLFFYVVII